MIGRLRQLSPERRPPISAVRTGANKNRHILEHGAVGPLTQNKPNHGYGYVSAAAAEWLYFWLWYFSQLNAADQT